LSQTECFETATDQWIKTGIVGKPTIFIVYWLIVRVIIKHDVTAVAVEYQQIGHCDSFLHLRNTVLQYQKTPKFLRESLEQSFLNCFSTTSASN
jgi:predicted SPOUT superfamily RNA methylase MTH1